MKIGVTMSKDPGYAEIHPDDTAWRIIQEWAVRHQHSREYTIALALKIGLTCLCEQMGEEDKER